MCLGAHILQLFVEELDKLLKKCLTVEDKRIDNVIVLLCQLYNFKVFRFVIGGILVLGIGSKSLSQISVMKTFLISRYFTRV